MLRRFLGISSAENITRKIVGQKKMEIESIDPDIYKRLMDFYAADIENLKILINKDLSKWSG